jgi:hypothetical protein
VSPDPLDDAPARSRLAQEYGGDLKTLEKPQFMHPAFYGYLTRHKKAFDSATTHPIFFNYHLVAVSVRVVGSTSHLGENQQAGICKNPLNRQEFPDALAYLWSTKGPSGKVCFLMRSPPFPPPKGEPFEHEQVSGHEADGGGLPARAGGLRHQHLVEVLPEPPLQHHDHPAEAPQPAPSGARRSMSENRKTDRDSQ